ncbi:MAG: PatB family C-S lyase [Puniceicoccales bacterium]|jgi:cystathionine beta-lyase|nr:PatB family C-S lyase [Puniceicoccales bacterium]
MPFDFDFCPERSGTDSIKWRRYENTDVIPAWVADMDFASPPCVREALRRRLEHPILGYATAKQSTLDAVLAYLERQHGWKVDPEWIVFTPAVVPSLHGIIRAVGEAGASVISTTPVYPPFLSSPALSGRIAKRVPMIFQNGCWTFDFDALDAAAAETQAKVFLLCNPYNPLGRVFERAELEGVAAFAERHGITVCSDEIHCDLVLDPAAKHITYGTLGEKVAQTSAVLFAASKTYNTAGLLCGYAVIPDSSLRQRFRRALAGVANEVNVFGFVALEAAYSEGEPWRLELLEYLRGNLALVAAEIADTPGVTIAQRPQATYLAWLDVRALGFADPVKTFEAGGVGLGNGADFGEPGFVRLNFGCPRERLREILRRIRAVALSADSRRS